MRPTALFFSCVLALLLRPSAAWAAPNWIHISDSSFAVPGYAPATWMIFVDDNSLYTTKIKGSPDQTLVVWQELRQNIVSKEENVGAEAANCSQFGVLYTVVPEHDHAASAPMTTRPGTSGFALWTHACNWYKKKLSGKGLFSN